MRNFGSTSHMKGEWDGVGTFIKFSVDRYVTTQAAADSGIFSAKDYHGWCHDNLSVTASSKGYTNRQAKIKLTGRHFLYVPLIDRSEKTIATVKEVLPIHQIFVTPAGGCLARHLGCVCRGCGERD
uniref:Uncharacterized protein n=1 Tax=Mantoniella antarctica TaxID=81844 RepID=A0A7S0STZ4_9CHLO|mmetsp:Transcript_35082/g.87777  ORF Transcript_35082/g.87777 Transcript_35082/m.87777 type:complete len:126 (+) Transcript_35082:815-1192(+)